MDSIKHYYQTKAYKRIFESYLAGLHDVENLRYLLYALFETGNWQGYIKIYTSHIEEIEVLKDLSRLLGYFGLAAYINGNYTTAKEYLKRAASENGEYSQSANKWNRTLQLDDFSNTVVGRMNFHFDNTLTMGQRNAFIAKYQEAYSRIEKFFPYRRKKQIDVFVFDGWKDTIGNNLSYANAQLSTIHVNVDDDWGHELTHIMVRDNLSIRSSFIDEGLAEFFDGLIRGYRRDHFPPVYSIDELYENFRSYDKDFAYLYARIFIAVLFEHMDGNCEKIRDVLEAPSVNAMHPTTRALVDLIVKKADTTLRLLMDSKKEGLYLMVGPKDLFFI